MRAEFLAVGDVPIAGKAGIVVPIHLECCFGVENVCVAKGGDAVVEIEGMTRYGNTRL